VQTGFKEVNPGLFVIPVRPVNARIQRAQRLAKGKRKSQHLTLALLFLWRSV
jgi:hypothetical protein